MQSETMRIILSFVVDSEGKFTTQHAELNFALHMEQDSQAGSNISLTNFISIRNNNILHICRLCDEVANFHLVHIQRRRFRLGVVIRLGGLQHPLGFLVSLIVKHILSRFRYHELIEL